jgi:hypothetical protein
MKKYLAVLSLCSLMAFQSDASYLVCAGPDLYYSSQRMDYGMPPMPGMLLGTTVIAYKGKVLLNRDDIMGEGQYSYPEYNIEFEGERSVVETSGNQVAGATIFLDVATVYKIDGVNPSTKKEVGTEGVLCTKTWALVP